jgi:hypothetical protein
MKRALVVFGLAVATTFVASVNASAQGRKVPKGTSAGVPEVQSGVNKFGRPYFGNGLYSYDRHYLGGDPDSRIRGQLLRDPPGNYNGLPQIR